MKIIEKKIIDLIDAEYNPRQLTEKQYEDLEQSIDKFGFVDPIIVNKNKDRKNVVIGGHQRIKIAKRMGINKVPCVELEQKSGYRSKVSKMGNVGIFSKQCKDCDKPCTKSFDVDTYNRMDRCYNCQMTFELDLKTLTKNKIGQNGNKWQFWVKLQQLKRWDAIDEEIEQFMMNKFEENKKNPFDKSIVNAMANANVSMEIKKNKT